MDAWWKPPSPASWGKAGMGRAHTPFGVNAIALAGVQGIAAKGAWQVKIPR
jgi:hypothetical protein